MDKDLRTFKSGTRRFPPSTRTFNDAIEDAKNAPEEKRLAALRRRYRSRGTRKTREITKRIVGERD